MQNSKAELNATLSRRGMLLGSALVPFTDNGGGFDGIYQPKLVQIGEPSVMTINLDTREITVADDVSVSDAAAKVIEAMRAYLAGMCKS